MIQKIFSFALSDNKNIEKSVDDDNLMINHMVLPEGKGLPEHYSNSNIYMIVIRGNMTLKLDEQEPYEYTCGQIINIPYHTKMNVNNFNKEILEIFVIKTPNPKNYGGI